jgi:hypothetical protein
VPATCGPWVNRWPNWPICKSLNPGDAECGKGHLMRTVPAVGMTSLVPRAVVIRLCAKAIAEKTTRQPVSAWFHLVVFILPPNRRKTRAQRGAQTPKKSVPTTALTDCVIAIERRTGPPLSRCAIGFACSHRRLGWEGFLKITRRQQMKVPVNARTAGTNPTTDQTASANQPNRPKCNSVSQSRALSEGSRKSKAANRSGNAARCGDPK